jgi:hypothetical protein
MSKIIETTVPIPVEQLREIIDTSDVKVIVDLTLSSVKPIQALIYLSNLDLDVDVRFDDADRLAVLDAYLNLPTLLKCPLLETMVLELILHLKGIIHVDYVDVEWCNQRREVTTKWASLIESTILFIPSIVDEDDMPKVSESFTEDTTNDMIGVNFVNVFDNELFPLVFRRINWSLVKNYSHYFKDYMYKGHNLFSFWTRPENTVHAMVMALIDRDVATDEEFSDFSKNSRAVFEKGIA